MTRHRLNRCAGRNCAGRKEKSHAAVEYEEELPLEEPSVLRRWREGGRGTANG